MTDLNRPWPALSPLQRFGPIAVVIALLVGAGAVATVKASSGTHQVGAGPGASVPGDSGPEGGSDDGLVTKYTSNPVLPVTLAEAREAGTVDDYDWGDRCDTETGRIMVPSVYAPPCVPAWDGDKAWVDQGGETHADNGGATAQGVTEDEIVIAFYVPGPMDLFGTAEALGVFDSATLRTSLVEDLFEMANASYEFYGRKLVLKPVQASGDGKNPAQARADARMVAEEIKAFASIGGPSQTLAYQDELARRGVLCIACGIGAPDALYQELAPYNWSVWASPDQILQGVLDFGAENLFGSPAQFAGDESMRSQPRVMGVIHYDQDPPIYQELSARLQARYKDQGAEARIVTSYLLDLNTTGQQAQAIIGRFKAEGITSIVFAGDPLMLIDLTVAATRQNYFPEWLLTGTVFTDTTVLGRLYDAAQRTQIFGASSSPARGTPDQSDAWVVYKWFFGKDPEAKKSLQLIGPQVTLLLTGLHMAGPNLTPDTFAGGMFRTPPSGGGPTRPQVSFGDHGLFEQPDFVGFDDFTVVWWDETLSGPDEQQVEGTGMWRYPLGGARLLLPDPQHLDEDLLFQDLPDSPGIISETPASDVTADYPPPAGSPAAAAD